MTTLHLSNKATCIAFCVFKSSVSRNYQTICGASNFAICNFAGCHLKDTCQLFQTQDLAKDTIQKISRSISCLRCTSRAHNSDITTGMIRCCDFFYISHIRVFNHNCFSITDVTSGISKRHIIIFSGCCYN